MERSKHLLFGLWMSIPGLLSLSAAADAQQGVSHPVRPLEVLLDDRTAEANPTPQDCGLPPMTAAGTETLIFIRHAEKTTKEYGQLSCKGQNRALLLPDTLVKVKKFGIPDFIYAPNPSVQIQGSGQLYSYVRPFATIEPTAIKLGMPVNTQIGYPDVCTLQNTLLLQKNQSDNSPTKIFIAWEHININQFASNILNTYNVQQTVPPWGNDDYDRIYVFTISNPANGSKPTLTFTEEHEDLNESLSSECATAAPKPQVGSKTGP